MKNVHCCPPDIKKNSNLNKVDVKYKQKNQENISYFAKIQLNLLKLVTKKSDVFCIFPSLTDPAISNQF